MKEFERYNPLINCDGSMINHVLNSHKSLINGRNIEEKRGE